MPTIDAETFVKAVAVRLETESNFLSPILVTVIADPSGLLKLAEDAGVSPEQIDVWLEEAREEAKREMERPDFAQN